MFGVSGKKRERVGKQPFPPSGLGIVEGNVACYRLFAPEGQAELRGPSQVVREEKRFGGRGGLEVTDEIRVTTSAPACVLTSSPTNSTASPVRTKALRRCRAGPCILRGHVCSGLNASIWSMS